MTTVTRPASAQRRTARPGSSFMPPPPLPLRSDPDDPDAGLPPNARYALHLVYQFILSLDNPAGTP